MTPNDAVSLFMMQVDGLDSTESARYERAIMAWNAWSAALPEEAATIMQMIIEVTRLAGDQEDIDDE